jgi:hypothetical protein
VSPSLQAPYLSAATSPPRPELSDVIQWTRECAGGLWGRFVRNTGSKRLPWATAGARDQRPSNVHPLAAPTARPFQSSTRSTMRLGGIAKRSRPVHVVTDRFHSGPSMLPPGRRTWVGTKSLRLWFSLGCSSLISRWQNLQAEIPSLVPRRRWPSGGRKREARAACGRSLGGHRTG